MNLESMVETTSLVKRRFMLVQLNCDAALVTEANAQIGK
jgi:hypothetical protein